MVAFTYFFRDLHMLELAVRYSAPCLSGRSYGRVWDAGCAMGQEPYSLGILLAENMGRFAFNNLRILASDQDSTDQFGPIVAAGVYPHEQLERMPAGILEKYFEPAGEAGYFKVAESIRRHVTYQKHDLLSLREIGEGFSLIMCKNVLLHLEAAERIDVVRMFHRALAPGGYFATEQTQKLPPECAGLFEQVAQDGQLYRRPETAPCA